MKKLVSLLLALIMVMSLAACGGSASSTPASQAGSSAPADSGNADSGSAGTADTLKVVSSFDPGTFQPGASDEQSYNRHLPSANQKRALKYHLNDRLGFHKFLFPLPRYNHHKGKILPHFPYRFCRNFFCQHSLSLL